MSGLKKIIERYFPQIDEAGGIASDEGNPLGNTSPDKIAAKPIRFGLIVIAIVFGVFGTFSVTAPIDSAAVAPGRVIQDSNKKTIQHLEGGIIKEILVSEGEKVIKDQPLVLLDEVQASAQLNSYSTQYYTALASDARLKAERENSSDMVLSEELKEQQAKSQAVADIIQSQQRLLDSRLETRNGQVAVLKQRIDQTGNEIRGLQSQISSAQRQMKLLDDEIRTLTKLLAQGNTSKPRLQERQRQRAALDGDRGNNLAMIARAKQRIGEDEIQILNVKSEAQTEINNELKEVQAEIAALSERIRSSADILQRGVIRSPIDGEVTGLEVFTISGVIEPGAKLMDIVPNNDELIVEARVSLQDIDVVMRGLRATVRLTAFGARSVPPVTGVVETISADRFDDERTGEAYYKARIKIDKEQLDLLEDVTLTPGMPADVLIVTGSRTFLSYLFKPITESMNKAFREQ